MDLPKFQQRLLERFLTHEETVATGDIDYLLERMDRLSRNIHHDGPDEADLAYGYPVRGAA